MIWLVTGKQRSGPKKMDSLLGLIPGSKGDRDEQKQEPRVSIHVKIEVKELNPY
jgi:hypothetical protein